jgi:hypothetical protein
MITAGAMQKNDMFRHTARPVPVMYIAAFIMEGFML